MIPMGRRPDDYSNLHVQRERAALTRITDIRHKKHIRKGDFLRETPDMCCGCEDERHREIFIEWSNGPPLFPAELPFFVSGNYFAVRGDTAIRGVDLYVA
jgi:hypothetical protein